MRVYHFVTAEHGLDDLRRKRLKVATIADLNDPFELRAMVLGTAHKRWAISEWRKDIASKIGLLCFSRDWHNPVQWSHYANKHTGLCLGFDVSDKFLMPVKYQSKLHPDLITPARDNSVEGESAVLKLLSTKYSHWRYEREVRMFLDLTDELRDGDLYFHAFDADAQLAEVIVGHQCRVSRAQLADALGEAASAVVATKARLAFNSFRVVKQQGQNLWS